MLSQPICLTPAAVRARMSFALGILGIGGVLLFGAPYVRQLVEPMSRAQLFELRAATGVGVAAMLMGVPNFSAIWLGRRYESEDPWAAGGKMLGVLGVADAVRAVCRGCRRVVRKLNEDLVGHLRRAVSFPSDLGCNQTWRQATSQNFTWWRASVCFRSELGAS
jgi:hypothetical protein